MTVQFPGGAALTVRGDVRSARTALDQFFLGRGWSAQERSPGRIDYERGSRRRSVLLGAFAGRKFHLTAPIELREGPGVTEIRYVWGESAGRALGGASGRARASRVHLETLTALEQQLGADGRLVQVRKF
ncbi:hypothetical protein ACT3SQ_03790 [Brachybacterium sp. AOP42-C2-15]|uniref:hypothetical protein n=1 Tax=unclassified Brachybacterium TaxID=2623841 RepID=UPI003F8F2D12